MLYLGKLSPETEKLSMDGKPSEALEYSTCGSHLMWKPSTFRVFREAINRTQKLRDCFGFKK